MSHFHSRGYELSPDAEIVALADLVPANAEVFSDELGVDTNYTDSKDILSTEDLDMVSICTWSHLHCDIVVAAAVAGVNAIHFEKPMAPT